MQYVQPAGQLAVPSVDIQVGPEPVPTGLPVGALVQQGSSISPGLVVAAVGFVAVAGALAYYLTRTAPR